MTNQELAKQANDRSEDELYKEAVLKLQSKKMLITNEELKDVDNGWTERGKVISAHDWDNANLD